MYAKECYQSRLSLKKFKKPHNSNKENYSDKNDELKQLGYINDYNGDANRVYDGFESRSGRGRSQDWMVCSEKPGG